MRLNGAKRAVLRRVRRALGLPLGAMAARNMRSSRKAWPLAQCIAKRRTARQPQPEMVKRSGLRRHPVAQLAQARKPAELRKKQGLEVTHTGPAARLRPNPVVAPVLRRGRLLRRNNAPHLAPIKGFQKAVQSARKMWHGRAPKSMSRQQDIGTKACFCLPCNDTREKDSGQQCAFAGMTLNL